MFQVEGKSVRRKFGILPARHPQGVKRSYLANGVVILGCLLFATANLTNEAFAGDPVVVVDRAPNLAEDGWANQEAFDFPDLSSYIVVDVTFDNATVVDTVSTYFDSRTDWSVLSSPQAVLNIFADPLTSADVPTTGMVVPVTITNDGVMHTITATDLGIELPAGDYWIGLTPMIDASVGQNFNLRSTDVGHSGNSFWRNPSGFFGIGTDWLSAPVDGLGEVFEQRGSLTIAGGLAETVVTVNSGVMLIQGSCFDDEIEITRLDTGVVILEIDGVMQTLSGVNSIEVHGNDGDDMITVSGRLPSSLFGNNGDDVIVGSAGPDYIEGGLGMDDLNGREGLDTIYASAPGVADTAGNIIQGGRSNDTIFGSNFKDTIFGGEANDTIYAFDGDDDIFGGQGADLIFAAGGNDIIRAGESNDEVYGGTGNDTIIGGLGFDLVYGGDGNDTITGGDGQDELYGGNGNDILRGNNNNDMLFGGPGNDTLTGGLQNDLLNGGPGTDTATDTGELGEIGIEL